MLQQRITAANIPELLFRLESAPYIDERDLFHYVSYKKSGSSFTLRKLVPVAKIIAAHHIENWGKVKDHRRTDAYVAAMANAMRTGELDLEALPPVLQEHGGAYTVTADGITRCALAKLLGMEFIPAEVTYEQSLLNCEAGTPDGYKALMQRWEEGLWQGRLTTYHTRSRIPFFRRFMCAVGDVSDYEGVWVFAKNIEQTKKIYQVVGASGKPAVTATEAVTEMSV